MKSKMKPVSNTEDGILTSMFRKVVLDTGMVNSIGFYITRYIKNGGKKNKATVTKITLDGEMTWKSFVFLIFEVLRVKKMHIKITLTHQTDLVSEHELEVTPLHKSSTNRRGTTKDARTTTDNK